MNEEEVTEIENEETLKEDEEEETLNTVIVDHYNS